MYPIQLNISAWSVVIVGGGGVATRKAKNLMGQSAFIHLISPNFTPELHTWAEAEQLNLYPQNYSATLLADLKPRLVFAATDRAALNQQILRDAQAIGALVNCADDPAHSDFANPLIWQEGPISLSISTGSPSFSKYLLAQIAATITPQMQILAAWFAEARPHVGGQREIWQAILHSPILSHLEKGEVDRARAIFESFIAG